MLHFLLSFLDAEGVLPGRPFINHFFPLCGTCRKKSLDPRFAILMPARVPLPIAKPFMYLAGRNSIVTGAKNPKSWEKVINHNRTLMAGISGFLAIPRLITFSVLWLLTNPKDVRTNLSDPGPQHHSLSRRQ